MRILIPVAVLILLGVFVVAVFWPWRSRRMQEKVKSGTEDAAGKARGRAGKAGDATAKSVEKGGRAVQESAHAGRRVHDELFDSRRGADQEKNLRQRYGQGAEHGTETDEARPQQADG